jgi:ATP-dependent Lon protease
MEMDHLDKLAASVLDGYLVRKDLVRTFSRQFPVPDLCCGISFG